MGIAHAKMVVAAEEALRSVFNDRSVPRQDTLESLKELSNEIDTMINFVQEELEEDGYGVF